jgi:DNA repair exonuclease SbcCD ATPase subunit
MSNRSDYRKLTKLIDALTALKNEIMPEKEGKGDPLEKQKIRVTNLVNTIRSDLELVKTMTNARDLIERKASLRHRFAESQEEVKKFADVLKKSAKDKKPADPKMHAKNIKRAHEWLELTQQEIMQLAEEARDIKVEGVSVGFDGVANKSQDRRELQKNRRAARRDRRRARGEGGEGGDGDDEIDGIYMEDMTPASDNERAFLAKVQQARQEEEELLEMISEGLTELHDLALTLNKLLKQSTAAIEELDTKMEKVQVRLDNTNKQLDELLEKSGGCNRWCPICICLMLLLACAGFLVTKFI